MHGSPLLGEACPTVLIGGKPAWRIGDQHTCPIPNAPPPVCTGAPHGPGVTVPIVAGGEGITLIGGKMAACLGDIVMEPGALLPLPPPNNITEGAEKVFIGEDPPSLAGAIRAAPKGSVMRAELVDGFARISTHGEPASRVVLGKWEDGGGYVAEAQKNGGIWYETPEGTYRVMGKEAAWETNEAFLKQQMNAGVSKLEFTGLSEDDIASELAKLDATGQPIEAAPARVKEFVFMQNNASTYGYIQKGVTFLKAQ